MFTQECLIINRHSHYWNSGRNRNKTKGKEQQGKMFWESDGLTNFPAKKDGGAGLSFFLFSFHQGGRAAFREADFKEANGTLGNKIMGFILCNAINGPILHTQLPGTHDITPPQTQHGKVL